MADSYVDYMSGTSDPPKNSSLAAMATTLLDFISESTSSNGTNQSLPVRSARPPTCGPHICDKGHELQGKIVDVYLASIFVIVGLIGNTLAMLVLAKQKRQQTMVIILEALAVSDSITLILTFFIRTLPRIHKCYCALGWLMKYFHEAYRILYPSVFVPRMMVTWLTTLLSIDRYIAVCLPMKSHRYLTTRIAVTEIVIIVVFSVAFSVPRFFEMGLYQKGGRTIAATTDLFKNTAYSLAYRSILFLLVMYLIPLAIMVSLNILLAHTLRKADRQRALLRHRQPEMKGSRGMAIMVMCVVIVFILCNMLPLAGQLMFSLEHAFPNLDLEKKRRHISTMGNLMVTINSSINFAIYCFCSKTFRDTLVRICGSVVTAICHCRQAKEYDAVTRHRSNISNSSLGTRMTFHSKSRDTSGARESLQMKDLYGNQMIRSLNSSPYK